MKDTQLSKFLALVLRHKPAEIGISLDEEGWVSLEGLLQGLRGHGLEVNQEDLERIVAADSKQRYTIRQEWVRANQGHSVAGVCAVELVPVTPPEYLYHGTTQERWEQIRASGGLKPGQRHHVHLSADLETARQVGCRHRGKLCLLRVRASDFSNQGGVFYRSANGVWLCDSVSAMYLESPP